MAFRGFKFRVAGLGLGLYYTIYRCILRYSTFSIFLNMGLLNIILQASQETQSSLCKDEVRSFLEGHFLGQHMGFHAILGEGSSSQQGCLGLTDCAVSFRFALNLGCTT